MQTHGVYWYSRADALYCVANIRKVLSFRKIKFGLTGGYAAVLPNKTTALSGFTAFYSAGTIFVLAIILLLSSLTNVLMAQKDKDTNRVFYEKGALKAKGRMVEGQKIGQWTTYYPDGSLNAKENFEGDLLSGICQYYYPSAQGGKIRSQEIYLKGVPSDSMVEYHSNGNLSKKGFYQNGTYEGVFYFFYPSGVKKRIGHYHEGRPDQIWEEYTEQGLLLYKIPFANGKEEGGLETYDAKGQLVSKKTYHKGKFTGETCLYKKGKLKGCKTEIEAQE
jgi:antitoxin component YwqK of YwqJK toxin-antitoxin module